MNRLLCYAHFDTNGQVQPFVIHALQAMKAHCSAITFVSNSPVSAADRENLLHVCSRILINDNTGYDFYMWKLALQDADIVQYDEVLLMNSSVYGPVSDISSVFSAMDNVPCDFWGITECFQMQPHIQSYFLIFRHNVIQSSAFASFWQGVLPYTNKLQVIQSYEVGLTQWLVESGFVPGVLCPLEQLGRYCRDRGRRIRKKDNISVKHAGQLLELGNPFLKRDAVRNHKIDFKSAMSHLQRSGYPEHLINERTSGKEHFCPLCGKKGKISHKGLKDYQNLHQNNRYDYARCTSSACGVLWRLEPEAGPCRIVHYPAHAGQMVSSCLPPCFSGPLGKLSPGNILEIGCDKGERLIRLQENGWNITAYTCDHEAVETLQRHNIRIIPSVQQVATAESSRFDCIIVSSGIEEADNQHAFLSGCHSMLKSGGTLLLRTPNSDALLSKIFRGYWFGLNAPRNTIIHTRQSLKAALTAAGFVEVRVSTSAFSVREYFQNSWEILFNKWTSPLTDRQVNKMLPLISWGAEMFCNFFARKWGEECIVTAKRSE